MQKAQITVLARYEKSMKQIDALKNSAAHIRNTERNCIN